MAPGGKTQCWLTIPLLLVLLPTTAVAASDPARLHLECVTNCVGQYERIEFSISCPRDYLNPFNPDEVNLRLEVTTPGGKTLRVPAFWWQPYERKQIGGRDWMHPSGPPGWAARYAPQEIGVYQARAVLEDSAGSMQSARVQFQSVRSSRRGYLRVSGKDPRFLELSTGQPFFPIGQNLSFIGNQQYVTLTKAERIFEQLAENGANYLRIWTCCEDWAMAIEARKSAFGRSWDWNPPVVPVPGNGSSGRKCLNLSPAKNLLKVEPSHAVALRPSTRYVLSFKAKMEGGGKLDIVWGSKRVEAVPAKSSGDGEWLVIAHEFETGAGEWWLPQLSIKSNDLGNVWISDLSLKQDGAGPELLWEADVNRELRGYYNPLDSFILDEIIASAEKNSILLQLCYLTRDLYMQALKNPDQPGYELAISDAKKAFRYAIARWGYSTSVGAWEYWNEMDPGLALEGFYTVLGEYLEGEDPYQHLRTTSTWSPSAKDCRHAKLDLADVHFYLRPADENRLEDEVEAVLERTRWLRQQAPNKPAHLGEFGIANDKWQPTVEMNRSREIVDFHNALWASALSGASGAAMFWWWDRLDQRDPYGHYKPLSRFITDVPWNSGSIASAEAVCSHSGVRTIGVQAEERVWLWLFNRESSWKRVVVQSKKPSRLSNAKLEVRNLPQGKFQVSWFDTRRGDLLHTHAALIESNVLRVEVPDFDRDIACKISP